MNVKVKCETFLGTSTLCTSQCGKSVSAYQGGKDVIQKKKNQDAASLECHLFDREQ